MKLDPEVLLLLSLLVNVQLLLLLLLLLLLRFNCNKLALVLWHTHSTYGSFDDVNSVLYSFHLDNSICRLYINIFYLIIGYIIK